MTTSVRPVPVGSRLIDSLPFSMGGTFAQARALAASGVDGIVGYIGPGNMTLERLKHVLDAGLGFMPVTLAGEFYDGPADEIAQLKALAIPVGVTVWLDVEGKKVWEHGRKSPPEVIALLADWANTIKAQGWVPGLYVGAPQPLTGKELYSLPFTRYWLGIGRCVDRTGDDAYPDCGWCMRQDWHNKGTGMRWRDTGVFVDTNAVQCDHRGRVPTWMVAG
jgi:hypothetical protein